MLYEIVEDGAVFLLREIRQSPFSYEQELRALLSDSTQRFYRGVLRQDVEVVRWGSVVILSCVFRPVAQLVRALP